VSHYLPPGQPIAPPPDTQPNSYIQPPSPQQPHMPHHPNNAQAATVSPLPPPQTPPTPQATHAQDNPHRAVLTEWRAHHGSDWVRADALHPAVRRMIDTRERIAAIRQRLRQVVATCPDLEARTTGNAARPVTFYRLIQNETA
jgi:hypothetical protein